MNFTEQSREEVVKSVVNWSISKQMWTFPKRKRFWQKKPECPMLAYNQNLSALTHKPISFATSTRNLFNDTRKIPSASEYHPTEESAKNVPLFGESREVIPITYRNALSIPTSRSNWPSYNPYHLEPRTQQIRAIIAQQFQEGIHHATQNSPTSQL
jgi:hypothetical protein